MNCENNNGDCSSSSVDDPINMALEELGLLSSSTNSRKQYIQENDRFYGRLASLTMADSGAGPSHVSTSSSSQRPSISSQLMQPYISEAPTVSIGNELAHLGQLPSNNNIFNCNSNVSVVEKDTKESSTNRSPITSITTSSPVLEITMASNNVPPQHSTFNFNAPLPPVGGGGSKESNGTEKENTLFSGYKVLTMNSKFITSFTSDYNLPHHVSSASKCSLMNRASDPMDKFYAKNCKRSIFRRKRLRTHPYENCGGTYQTMLHMYPSSGESGSDSFNPRSNSGVNSYRSRTTSLSSGTCGRLRKRGTPNNIKSFQLSEASRCNSEGRPTRALVVRSRSMENLSNGLENETESSVVAAATADAILLKTKDVETVSRAIQQMCVQDSG